jgi:hypothetical protein
MKALNPSLISDAGENDYISLLCGHGYDRTTQKLISGVVLAKYIKQVGISIIPPLH